MSQTRLGEGRHRLGSSEEVRLSVNVPERQANALVKLRVVKGCNKSEVVALALDLALALSPEEIARRVRERRDSDL